MPPAYINSHAGALRESCPMQSRFWQHTDWNTLYLSMRVLDGDVVEGEHAVEGFDEKLYLRLHQQPVRAYASRHVQVCKLLKGGRGLYNPMYRTPIIWSAQ